MAYNFDSKKLAKDVLNKRTKDGLSFRSIETATKKRLTIATLQRIEASTQVPSAETLGFICQWLGNPVNTYFK